LEKLYIPNPTITCRRNLQMALFVKSAVRGQLKGMRASEDFFKALDKQIAAQVAAAVTRAKGNGRKTCRGCDI
jgi:hypothetical protein